MISKTFKSLFENLMNGKTKIFKLVTLTPWKTQFQKPETQQWKSDKSCTTNKAVKIPLLSSQKESKRVKMRKRKTDLISSILVSIIPTFSYANFPRIVSIFLLIFIFYRYIDKRDSFFYRFHNIIDFRYGLNKLGRKNGENISKSRTDRCTSYHSTSAYRISREYFKLSWGKIYVYVF